MAAALNWIAMSLLIAAPSSLGTSEDGTNLTLGTGNLMLSGGASFIPGHGAPTGLSLRTGNPGQTTSATLNLVLAPGSTLTGLGFSYRYVTGYGPSGIGANLSLVVLGPQAHSHHDLDTANSVVGSQGQTVLYSSPHFVDHMYSQNASNYSDPIKVSLSGLSIAASADGSTRLQFQFENNDRNLQVLIPISMSVACDGAGIGEATACLAPAPGPAPSPPPLPPLPPTPPPPATHTPWTAVGPSNIGDSITPDGGESGTLQPVVAAAANPDIIYTGGNNNAASSGVLKSVDFGRHWTKVNVGLTDTRIHGLYIVDPDGNHVMVGTPSGVFESLDAAATWTHVTATAAWGVANTFRNGTINGKPYLFVGTNAGLGNVPLVQAPLINQTWSLILSPPGSAAWRTNAVSIADFRGGVPLSNSVVGGCLWVGGRGVLHLGTVLNTTAMAWEVQTDQPCQSMAMDPNDADHMLVNNASNGAHIYESTDGGKSFHGCLNYRGAVMVAIDRTGWFYVGSEAGIYRNAGGCVSGKWEPMFDRRIARRNGAVRDKVPHDFQGINIDFGGNPAGVAFGSDQGMFMKNVKNVSDLRFISGNGNMNNNIIMHPSIAEGEEPNTRYIVTAMWDWGPVASWDNGTHWPSWQTPDDGASVTYMGEGGGCFGMGQSKYALCIHHHDVGFSSRGGKNFSRFIVPHGGSVGGSEFARAVGSRSVPSGLVYAPMTMGAPPWDTYVDKRIACDPSQVQGDLGVATSYSCLSQADIGLEYKWFTGVNVAIWRGATDKHCVLCKLAGNASTWNMTAAPGDVSFALFASATIKTIDDYAAEEAAAAAARQTRASRVRRDDPDGPGDNDDDFKNHVAKQRQLEYNSTCSEWNAVMPQVAYAGLSAADVTRLAVSADGPGNKYVLKSWNFGANWTWIQMPGFLQGVGGFTADPTNDTLYTVAGSCIARSYDQAETWESCWKAPGLVGSFEQIIIKDSSTMIVMRSGDVPLRTTDGGASWHRLGSLVNVAKYGLHGAYSWSGKTLAVSGVAGQLFLWVSRDDGDTWTDETGDYSSMSGGVAQWYDNTLYIASLGQGISSKTFPE